MPLPAKAFQRWLHGVAPDGEHRRYLPGSPGSSAPPWPSSWSAGRWPKPRWSASAGPSTSIRVAALASFENYAELAGPPLPPTAAELVSQIATMDLLRAVIARSAPDAGPAARRTGQPQRPTGRSSPAPHATSVRNWVDAIDDGELRHRVSAATGRRTAELFGPADRQPARPGAGRRHRPGCRRRTDRRAGGHRPGHRGRGRLAARGPAGGAGRLSDGELTALAGDRLQALGKALRRQEQDQEQTEKIWENLG